MTFLRGNCFQSFWTDSQEKCEIREKVFFYCPTFRRFWYDACENSYSLRKKPPETRNSEHCKFMDLSETLIITHSLAPSLPRSLAPSLPCSLAPSLPRSLAPSLPRSLAPSLPHSLTPIFHVTVCFHSPTQLSNVAIQKLTFLANLRNL